ncbi:hypothetical protein GCM10027445_64720 [Amycolatopsis endophytica]|uniref:Uncharacterized protein n=1 Tax=Amycolatopsis endophytica TaxID=860233 RepID=A0A853B4D7_9PSEU|nr:hypothetical protein [Amycolatopsis endophytica]NYI89860.1 hypothetical protein [Amycolatopsis endophytica]
MRRRDLLVMAVVAAVAVAVVAAGVALVWLTLDGTIRLSARYGDGERPNSPAEAVFLVAVGVGMVVCVLVPLGRILTRRLRPGPRR